MTESDEINRAIAEMRGWTTCQHPAFGETWLRPNGNYGTLPDYLLWQHCGPLLTEMIAADVRVSLTRFSNGRIEVWLEKLFVTGQADTLPDAIRRAWKAWKEQ